MNLFQGILDEEIQSMYACLGATEKRYKKGQTIWHNGKPVREIANIREGMVYIKTHDMWDHEEIIGEAEAGEMFGEAYACAGKPLGVDVVAGTDCFISFLSVGKILTPCGKACAYHTKLISNLLSIMAAKNLALTEKIKDISPRTIRKRVISYLERESVERKSISFEIPFNRQQLADYLCVDRSALSATLSNLAKEGVLYCDKSSFILKKRPQ